MTETAGGGKSQVTHMGPHVTERQPLEKRASHHQHRSSVWQGCDCREPCIPLGTAVRATIVRHLPEVMGATAILLAYVALLPVPRKSPRPSALISGRAPWTQPTSSPTGSFSWEGGSGWGNDQDCTRRWDCDRLEVSDTIRVHTLMATVLCVSHSSDLPRKPQPQTS